MWQAAFNGQRTWSESQGEDRWRRALYVFLRRTVPYPSLATFDATSREACTLRRSRTNTPLQAFVTLNDPVYVEAAQAFARRIVREGGDDLRSRAEYGVAQSLVRPPDAARVAVVEQLFERALERYTDDPDAALALATDPLGPIDSMRGTGSQGPVDGPIEETPEEPVDKPRESPAELAAWTVVANVLLNQDAVLVKD